MFKSLKVKFKNDILNLISLISFISQEETNMPMAEKIRILLVMKHLSVVKLAEKLGTSSQNLYNKLKRDNFSEKECREIAEALGCEYEGFFFLENGNRI